MLDWLKKIVGSKKSEPQYGWDDLLSGDFVKVFLKDPKKVGIISDSQSLTYQRLDLEDIQRGYVEGFVVQKETVGQKPALVELLEINVVKKHAGNNQRLISYLLLREEIEKLCLIEDRNE
jgi:hypothetical protein